MRYSNQSKRKMVTMALLFLCVLLNGCSQKDKDTFQSNSQISPTITQSSAQITDPSENTIDNITPTIATDKVQTEYKTYADFLGINNTVKKCLKEDIDNDGYQEIVIGFPIDNVYIKIYVLREKGETLQKLGEIDGNGYSISDFNLVKLQDMKSKYILSKITNGPDMQGFDLRETTETKLQLIVYSASPNGSGNDYLVDQNNDGLYDGYEQSNSSNDMLNLSVTRYYQLTDGQFLLTSTKVNPPEFVLNSQEVVSYYLKLDLLMLHENISNAQDLLKTITSSNKTVVFQDPTKWWDAFQASITVPETVNINSIEEGDNSTVTVHYEKEDITFHLNKVMNDWVINDIAGDNVINSSLNDSSTASDGSSTIDTSRQLEDLFTDHPISGEVLFTGAIGGAKVHARLIFDGNSVTGEYYYDKDESTIKLKGNIYDYQREGSTVTLSEDTFQNGIIQGIMRSDDYIQGFWRSGDKMYPMYLVSDDSKLSAPNLPDASSKRMQGHWSGLNSSYFSESQMDIYVMFDNLIYYELHASNGAHTGDVEGFGILENGIAKTVFVDATYEDPSENVSFQFSFQGDNLKLTSNQYDYYCGAGVEFEEFYTRKETNIELPNAIEVGIVETKEQDDLFHKLVGERYQAFIQYTQYADYSDVLMDDKEVKAGQSYLKGMSGYCYYIVSDNYLYTAIIVDKKIEYYTNDKNYADKLPEPMVKWARDIKVNYHYVEM